MLTQQPSDQSKKERKRALQFYLFICQFTNGPPAAGSHSLFAIFAGLLRRQMSNSSASSVFPLPFHTLFPVVLVVFLRWPRHYLLSPSVILHRHTTTTHHSPFFLKQLMLLKFLSLITSFLTVNCLEVVATLLQKSISVFKIFFSLTCNPVSRFPNRNLKCFASPYKIFISL